MAFSWFPRVPFLSPSKDFQSRMRTQKIAVSRSKIMMTSKKSKNNVLIVNTKGGGHAVIGPHLAEQLLNEGHSVTVHQVGPESDKGPFARYSDLKTSFSGSFSLSFGDVDKDAVPCGVYDAIYDNNAKSPQDVEQVIAAGKAGAEVFYVSSAGAYKYNPSIAPHLAGDPASGPTIDVEDTLRSSGVLAATFRPIYIIGPGTAKREYTDYFFHRIARDRPVLIPGNGEEFVSISDVRDVASIMTASLGKKLSGEIINSVSIRAITAQGMAKMCAKVMGKNVEIIPYDPEVMKSKLEGFNVKKAYPFRPRHFFADPFPSAAVTRALRWSPKFSGSEEALERAIADEYATFIKLDLAQTDVDFALDDAIRAAASMKGVEALSSK